MRLPWDKKKKALELQKVLPPKTDIDKYIDMAEKIKNTVEQTEQLRELASSLGQLPITPGTKHKGVNPVAGPHPSAFIFDEIGQMKINHGMPMYTMITPNEFNYEVKSYPDGSKYVIAHQITTQMVFKINSYEDLWILNQLHDIVKNSGLQVEVTIPNLIDAQADRRFAWNQPHGLKLVCEFLNSMTNFSFKVFHPHNAEVVEALLDRVEIIDNWKFISQVITKLNMHWDGIGMNPNAPLILMSTDAGGFKPLMKLADKLKWEGETYSASKSRKYEDGKSKLIQLVDRTDFEGKDILIIDDICSKGGTFKGLSKLLKERNCGKLYLAVSHMTIRELGDDSVTDYFDKVFTTNSKYNFYKEDSKFHIDSKDYNPPSQPKNLEIIKLF